MPDSRVRLGPWHSKGSDMHVGAQDRLAAVPIRRAAVSSAGAVARACRRAGAPDRDRGDRRLFARACDGVLHSRTLRQFVTVVVFVPSAISVGWFTVFGGNAIW